MKKKLVSMLLCMAMAATMITGCGDKKAGDDAADTASRVPRQKQPNPRRRRRRKRVPEMISL